MGDRVPLSNSDQEFLRECGIQPNGMMDCLPKPPSAELEGWNRHWKARCAAIDLLCECADYGIVERRGPYVYLDGENMGSLGSEAQAAIVNDAQLAERLNSALKKAKAETEGLPASLDEALAEGFAIVGDAFKQSVRKGVRKGVLKLSRTTERGVERLDVPFTARFKFECPRIPAAAQCDKQKGGTA